MNTSIFDLYLKYAPNKDLATAVYHHCELILQFAHILSDKNNLKPDWNLLEPATLLHDIGVFQCDEYYHPKVVLPYIQHSILGALIARAEGFSEDIALLIERHIGSGISAAEIRKYHYPLPERDFVPQTLEEKLLCYADNFHSKSRGFVTKDQMIKSFTALNPESLSRLQSLMTEFGIVTSSDLPNS